MSTKIMTSEEIRMRFIEFFKQRGHAIIPSASLIPENDPSVLFTTAGMHPLVPYLLGQQHPKGKRLVGVQKCVRTQDIDEVGDNTHDTFFEMLGNWSFGDYFKKEAIAWSYEFLTSTTEGLGLDPARLYITVFGGNDDAPRDEESYEIWRGLGIPESRIYYTTTDKNGKSPNWWSPGNNGPCGPDTEMFYDVTPNGLGNISYEEYKKADDTQRVVEIWNDVFIEYEKKGGAVIGKLEQKNVDTGAGLERLAMVMQEKDSIFDTDLFADAMREIRMKAGREDGVGETLADMRAMRIIADHIRAAVLMISDGVRPSNTDQGYVLRRLIRRSVMYADALHVVGGHLGTIADVFIHQYAPVYELVKYGHTEIGETIETEARKFRSTLLQGERELKKMIEKKKNLTGLDAFNLYQSYGYPLELTKELLEKRLRVPLSSPPLIDESQFFDEMKKHKTISRAGAVQKFKGGLADHSEKTTALHTATHLMLAGLRKYLGNEVHQAGSNITEERTRFDFTYKEKVPREILDKVEIYVNEAIDRKCDVATDIMKKDDAQKNGVEGSFWEKYPDKVTVYSVKCGDEIYSQELCGGPHVENTGHIHGRFKIKKEEASSAGVRRVKAVLE